MTRLGSQVRTLYRAWSIKVSKFAYTYALRCSDGKLYVAFATLGPTEKLPNMQTVRSRRSLGKIPVF